MVPKSLVALLWFPLTLVLLIVNLTLLKIMVKKTHTASLSVVVSPLADMPFGITAAAGTSQVLGAHVIAGDARGLLLQSFLKEYDSPMAPYANLIVTEADTNGFDFRLLVAIAMCESNLGKHMPTSDSYNAFGIAVYTGQQTGATFKNWPEAIRWVSHYIKESYYAQGLIDLRAIGAKWAPPSVNTGYSWTNCVSEFQKSIL